MTASEGTPALPPIRAVLLRSVLLLELDAACGAVLQIDDLCAGVERRGFRLPGRASKAVSDALRTEVAHGRAQRVGRGRYRIGRFPRTSRWRCRQRVAAALHGQAPPHHFARPRRDP